MTVSFGLTNAGNDWWWGIDDVEISGRDSDTGDAAGVPPPVGTLSLLHESFEGLELQTPVHERSCTDKKSWTAKPPSGWSVDNRNMATGGMDDFRGWTFMLQDHWQMYVTRKKNLLFFLSFFFVLALGFLLAWKFEDAGGVALAGVRRNHQQYPLKAALDMN